MEMTVQCGTSFVEMFARIGCSFLPEGTAIYGRRHKGWHGRKKQIKNRGMDAEDKAGKIHKITQNRRRENRLFRVKIINKIPCEKQGRKGKSGNGLRIRLNQTR